MVGWAPRSHLDEQGNCFDLESLQLGNDGLVRVFEGNAVFRNERGYLSPVGPIHFRRATGDE